MKKNTEGVFIEKTKERASEKGGQESEYQELPSGSSNRNEKHGEIAEREVRFLEETEDSSLFLDKEIEEVKKRVYVCPEPTCVHHDPSRALGDLTGIKKHFCRKHGEKKWKCDKCSKKYAVQSDWKAHSKICGTREYKCDCGTSFSRFYSIPFTPLCTSFFNANTWSFRFVIKKIGFGFDFDSL